MKFRKDKNVVNKAYKFLIQPNDEQKIMFGKTFGCCRYVWNRMLSDAETSYKDTGKSTIRTPAAYKSEEECKWLSEVDSLALANVQLALNRAYDAFFKKISDFPKYKKKHRAKESYTTNRVNNNIRFENSTLTLPKIKGGIRVIAHRKVIPGGTLKSVTISKSPNGKYYASILFEYPKEENEYTPSAEKSVGLDMSMKELFVSSDGELGDYPRFYRQKQDKIAKEQRKLSHMQPNSKNYAKQQLKIAKLYSKTKNQRSDFLHKLSHSLTLRYDYIFIEDLNMQEMAQNLNLGKSVYDNGWGMFTFMLNYKLKNKGGRLIKIDKWFPSSKTCSVCGHKHKSLTLADRIFICPECGNLIDRDYQAALNIKKEGLRVLTAA